jgi:hypothetical protein
MDPNPNFTMPESSELPPPPRPAEAGAAPTPETQPARAETAGVQAELPPAPPAGGGLPAPLPPMPIPASTSQPQAQPTVALPSDFPEIAEDNDLIEQEWVNKAKEIVERTRNDPHEQNKEINKVKADYIKKRYNREIKITEA